MKLNKNIYENISTKKKAPKVSPTESMKYDVCAITGDVLNAIPTLDSMSSFKAYPGSTRGELNRDSVVKYVVLMYSQDSILNQKPPIDLPERKLKAAELAGFERGSSGSFRKSIVDKLFNLKSNYVLDMVFDYLKHQNNHIWTEICTNEQELDEYTRRRLTPVSDEKDKDEMAALEKKDKFRASCKAIIKDLDEYYSRFFQDHEDVKEKVKSEKKFYKIEDYAREL
jgi:hypothetical protein